MRGCGGVVRVGVVGAGGVEFEGAGEEGEGPD